MAVNPSTVDQEELRTHSVPHDQACHNGYVTFANYYDGTQSTYITDRAKTYLEVSGLPYNENFCETIVDALVERCNVVGVECEEQAVADWVWATWWARNQGDSLALDVHTESAKSGDSYVLLDWDAERSLITAAYNDAKFIDPHYVDGVLTSACKVWDTNATGPMNPNGLDVKRMNRYFPDRIEKWFTLAKDDKTSVEKQVWAPWSDVENEPWPVAWVDAAGKPLGLPIYHFANRPKANRMGRSELRGVIPQQDRLNKELLDLSYVLDQMGWPQRYATGLADSSALKSVPGEVWTADSTEARFGQFDAADAAGLLSAIGATLMRMALRSGTPVFRLMLEGGYPSGEALKVGEAALVAKSKTRMVKWGTVWSALFRGVVLAQMAFAPEGTESPVIDPKELDEYGINPVWGDPESRNEKEHLETLGLMAALGVSKDTLLSMLPGIDPQAERIKGEREAREKMQQQQEAIDRGLIPEGGGDPTLTAQAKNGSRPKPAPAGRPY